jgi:hypothetical protein
VGIVVCIGRGTRLLFLFRRQSSNSAAKNASATSEIPTMRPIVNGKLLLKGTVESSGFVALSDTPFMGFQAHFPDTLTSGVDGVIESTLRLHPDPEGMVKLKNI